MSTTTALDTSVFQQWIAEKLDMEKVRERLHALGFNEESIGAHLQKFRSLKHARKRTLAFICMGGGAFLGFVSCLLSLTNPIPSLYDLFLFGLTSLSVLVICLGLYFLFE